MGQDFFGIQYNLADKVARLMQAFPLAKLKQTIK